VPSASQLDLSNNFIGGHYEDYGYDSDTGDYVQKYVADPEGVQAIACVACALRVNGALTRVDVGQNNIAGDGAVQLAAAVLGNFKIEIFNEIPIKEMRANSLTELDLNGKDFGVEGGMVVAGLIPVMGVLTSLNLSSNQLCGLDRRGRGTYTAEGITALADALRVNGGLLTLNLSINKIGGEGVQAMAGALRVNGALTEVR
jgi:hypothetical protein